VDIVERLLIREEIDSLELDLARAREMRDDGAVAEIGSRIARLEAALAASHRADHRLVGDKLNSPLSHAA